MSGEEIDQISLLGEQHKMRLRFKETGSIYVVVEGQDSEYFYCKFKPHLPPNANIHFIESKGKKNVLKNYDIISNLEFYNDYKILFIVDRDFDDMNLSSDIYVTETYSIENFYVNKQVIEDILKHAWHIEDEPLKKIISLYIDLQNKFHENVLEFNSLIRLQKEKSKLTGEEIKLRLNDIDLKKIVNISINGVNKLLEHHEIFKLFNKAVEYTNDELEEVKGMFDQKRYSYDFRGKYEYSFLLKFLEVVQEELGKGKLFNCKKGIAFSPSYCTLSDFAQYAEFPVSMKEYFINRIA